MIQVVSQKNLVSEKKKNDQTTTKSTKKHQVSLAPVELVPN